MLVLDLSWKVMVARGAVGVIFGIVAMVWPLSTVIALVVLWGVWALIDGIGAFVAVFTVPGTGAKIGFALLGLLAIGVAIFCFVRPDVTAAALTWVLGIWLIVRGLVDAVVVLMERTKGTWALALVAALLSVVIGVLFVANPGKAVVSIAWILGLVALVWGVVFLVLGFITRSVQNSLQAEIDPGTHGQGPTTTFS